jgi:hypothetical protein
LSESVLEAGVLDGGRYHVTTLDRTGGIEVERLAQPVEYPRGREPLIGLRPLHRGSEQATGGHARIMY